jgi:hypothetical protein
MARMGQRTQAHWLYPAVLFLLLGCGRVHFQSLRDGARDASPDAAVDAGPGDATADAPQESTYLFGERGVATYSGVTEDTYVSETSPDGNFGADQSLAVETSPARVGLVQFDLSALPPCELVAVELALVTASNALQSGRIEVRQVTEAWAEFEATHTDRLTDTPWAGPGPSYGPTVLAEFTPDTPGEEHRLALDPSMVSEWIDRPETNHGLALVSPNSSGDSGALVTRENPEASDRPLLELTCE